MFKNYLKVTLRNLFRYKGFSLINISGLAIGVTACLLIMLYVQEEWSYDRHHEKADRIYRVILKGNVGGNDFNTATACAPMAGTLLREFPEIEQTTRFRNFGFPVMRYKDKVFSEEKFYSADSTFFEVFTVPFLKGDPKTALNKPNAVVLTRSMAQKYFGQQNPLGKALNADNRRDYLVTGVVEDPPETSHFHFDFLGSLATYDDSRNTQWVSNNYYTYVLLKEGVEPEAVESKLPLLVRKYVDPQIQKAVGITYDQLVQSGGSYEYFLQPLTDIHLHSDLDYEIEPNGNAATVTIFGLIAAIILLIACVNFTNLATARSANRAKEVGVRKTLGSNRAQLVWQFLAETVFLAVMAVGIAVILVQLVLPWFNELTGKQLALGLSGSWMIWPLLAAVAGIVGVLAGIYPALFLASFKPVKVLRAAGGRSREGHGGRLRSALVVFQFTVSIILIIGVFVVRNQLEFIQNKRLGFDKEHVVIVHKTDDIGAQIQPFMQSLKQHAKIINASNSNTLPGLPFNSNVHQVEGAPSAEQHLLFDMRADHDFAATYQVQLTEGRYFSREWPTDSSGIILNETAVRAMGIEQPVGKKVIAAGPTPQQSDKYTIIGVVEDFHFESLHQKIRPMAIKLFDRKGFGRYISVRLAPGELQQTISYIENTWREFAGNQAFEYTFFDQDFAKLYDAEQRTSDVLTLFAGLAVIIACLGLFGLASFTTEQRTKEIGIRKALGASAAGVVVLLSRQFTGWVILANLIAWPLAYLLTQNWLQNFAYHTDFEFVHFIFAAGLALLIALVTVSYQTIRAALANPVESLRYE